MESSSDNWVSLGSKIQCHFELRFVDYLSLSTTRHKTSSNLLLQFRPHVECWSFFTPILCLPPLPFSLPSSPLPVFLLTFLPFCLSFSGQPLVVLDASPVSVTIYICPWSPTMCLCFSLPFWIPGIHIYTGSPTDTSTEVSQTRCFPDTPRDPSSLV